jgi:hypothetical protein
MLDSMLDALEIVREEERAARRALEQGYRDDLAALGRLITGPLRKARSAFSCVRYARSDSRCKFDKAAGGARSVELRVRCLR